LIAPNKFKPSATPETWIKPTTACRLSTLVTAARYQTLDEYFTNPSGKPYTKTQRTRVMRRLRALAADHRGESVAAAKGYSRGNALYAYRKLFPELRAEPFDPTGAELKQALRDGYFVSLSGNVDDVPGSSRLDDKVGDVPHEVGLARLNGDGTQVLVYEPMSHKPFWVRWAHVTKFGSEFRNNKRYFCIRFEIGVGSAGAVAERKLRAVRDERNTLKEDLALAERDIEELNLDLADYEWKNDPEWVFGRTLDRIIDSIEDERDEGYE